MLGWPASSVVKARAAVRARANDAQLRRSRVIGLLPEEASWPRREAAVPAVGTDDDERLARAAPGYADGILGPLQPGADERSLENGLHYFSREDRGLGVRAVQLEASARFRRLHRHGLHVVEDLRLAGTPGKQERRDSRHHKAKPKGHCMPPIV